MYIFRLDDSQATNKSAQAVGEAHFDGTVASRAFTKQWRGSFALMSLADMQATCWLGHADTTMMGEYTASEFVQKFTREFEAQFKQVENKLEVKHLYLLGCETGLIEQGTALAQQIADGLEKNGFKNVVVHAIANPPQPDRAMIIKIVDSPSFGDQLMGEVHAMLLTKAQASRLSELQTEISSLERQRKTEIVRTAIYTRIEERRQIEEQALMFLDTIDIKAELDRPHNCFVPHQAAARPAKLLAQEVALMKIDKMIKQLAFAKAGKTKVEQSVTKMVRKVRPCKRDDISNLKALKQEVAQHVGENWWHAVESAKKLFSETAPCYRLLDDISKEMRQSSVSLTAAPSLFSSSAPDVGRRTNTRLVSFATEVMQRKPEMSVAMRSAIQLMTRHAAQLEHEYRQSWVGQAIKLYKAQTLRDMVAQLHVEFGKNPEKPEWLPIIEAALRDSKLVQGKISHRTLDLLRDIVTQNQLSERTPLLRR